MDLKKLWESKTTNLDKRITVTNDIRSVDTIACTSHNMKNSLR